jgi:hypothetical protein
MPKKIIRKKVPRPIRKNKAIKTKHGYQTEEQAKYGGTIGEASRRASQDAIKKLKWEKLNRVKSVKKIQKHNVKDPY